MWLQMVQETSGVIRRNKGFLRGMNVGPTPFVLAVAMEGVLSLTIRFLLIALAVPVLGLSWPAQPQAWLYMLLALATLMMSAIAIGTLLAPWAAIYADVRKALSSISLPLILLSPIFYPPIEVWGTPLFWVNVINPVGVPLAVLNASFQQSVTIYQFPLFCVAGVVLIFNVFGLKQLHRQVPIVLERVGN
jgi:ABC-type polysaccharide/polyol phosphate export permease